MSLTHWIERIWAGLQIRSLDTVPSPWFLFPGEDQQELKEDEAQTLLADLRQRLFDHPSHPNVAVIKHRLGALSDEERIVLLYAMRYIALKGAGQNRYWPVCHTMLFAEKISLQRLQVELAPVLTEQWLRIYSRTKGRLFRPRQGKRNIKWPISHAGLLVSDKQLLLQFRTDMAHKYNQEEFLLLLDDDHLDDFFFELDEWLSHPDRRSETITQTLQDSKRPHRKRWGFFMERTAYQPDGSNPSRSLSWSSM